MHPVCILRESGGSRPGNSRLHVIPKEFSHKGGHAAITPAGRPPPANKKPGGRGDCPRCLRASAYARLPPPSRRGNGAKRTVGYFIAVFCFSATAFLRRLRASIALFAAMSSCFADASGLWNQAPFVAVCHSQLMWAVW